MHTPRTLILASSSRYRASLLDKLGLKFRQFSPEIDESALSGESPAELALRLGKQKGQKVAEQFPHAWIISSDQVASLDNVQAIGKPGTAAKAIEQLTEASGKVMQVYTSVSLQCQHAGFEKTLLNAVQVQFRQLSEAQIAYYVATEIPLDCAGSVKSEALGAALLKSVNNQDPSALIGLPILQLCDLFAEAGIDILQPGAFLPPRPLA